MNSEMSPKSLPGILRIGPSALLTVEVTKNNFLNQGCRNLCSVATVFHYRRDNNLRISGRRIANKPGVIRVFLLCYSCQQLAIGPFRHVHDLSSSGFSGNLN